MFDIAYFHIGFDKTGSTSIQIACHENRTILSKFGFLYPNGQWHAQFGSYFCDDPRDYVYNRSMGRSQKKKLEEIKTEDAQYMASLEQQIEHSDANVLILSYEGFQYLDGSTLQKIRKYIERIAKIVKIVIYCRDPISYAISAASQRAKKGVPSWSGPPIQNFKNICERFSSVFGPENLVVRKFDKNSLPGGDVRLDFLYQIGLGDGEIGQLTLSESKDNTSLSAEAIAILDALHNLGLSKHSSEFDFNRRYIDIFQRIQGSKYRLSQEQHDEVILASRGHVAYLREHFGIEFEEKDEPENPMNSSAFGQDFLASVARIIHECTEKK